MKADLNDRIGQHTSRDEKKSTIIIVTLSTLLMGAIAALGYWKTNDFHERELAEKTSKLEKAEARRLAANHEAVTAPNKPGKQSREKKDQIAIVTTEETNWKNKVNYYTEQKQSTQPSYKKPNKRRTSLRSNIPWQWVETTGKKRSVDRGVFHLTLQGDLIDASSICDNYPNGSIKYRNCRKAAKQWLKDNCTTAAPEICKASNMHP